MQNVIKTPTAKEDFIVLEIMVLDYLFDVIMHYAQASLLFTSSVRLPTSYQYVLY